jgi:hypothetical protein
MSVVVCLLHCPMEEGFCFTKTTGSSSPAVEGHALYWRERFFNLLREASSQVDASLRGKGDYNLS